MYLCQVKGPSDTCLDNLGPGVGHRVGVYSCHGKGQNQVNGVYRARLGRIRSMIVDWFQFWKLMASGELVSDNLCLDGDGESPRKIVLYECHGLKGNQQWFITEVSCGNWDMTLLSYFTIFHIAILLTRPMSHEFTNPLLQNRRT